MKDCLYYALAILPECKLEKIGTYKGEDVYRPRFKDVGWYYIGHIPIVLEKDDKVRIVEGEEATAIYEELI